jgi:diketogulonate reductase-like aldo/keto reductase
MANIRKSAHGLPVVGFGTWEVPPVDVERVIANAIDAGYRHIDCAWIYKNEKEVGAALRKACEGGKVKREELFITSKVWNTHKSPEDVRLAVTYTLQCLGLDYLDLYLVHWPVTWHPVPLDSALWGGEAPEGGESGSNFSYVPLSDTWRAMEKLVEEGLVKQIGVSNFGVQLLADLLTYAKIKPICNQVELHPYHAQPSLLKVALLF